MMTDNLNLLSEISTLSDEELDAAVGGSWIKAGKCPKCKQDTFYKNSTIAVTDYVCRSCKYKIRDR